MGSGKKMETEIFLGPCYYQRLKHMVSDKYQVRAVGGINQLHKQPIKGRKRGGGVRFGEMERDALIAHGVTFLLQDRLLNCSDGEWRKACRLCGSSQSPQQLPSGWFCRNCDTGKGIETVILPHVYTYMQY